MLEIVDGFECSQCSHRAESLFQLDHHRQRKHKRVHAAELFHAIVEPEQFACISCDYKSYYQFELYEHCNQAHNPRAENEETPSLCQEFAGYTCDYYSSLTLIQHHASTSPTQPPRLSVPLVLTDEPDSKQNIKSNHCSYQYANTIFLKIRHSLSGHVANKEIVWYKCSYCSYQCKRKSYLPQHVLRHAANEEIDWFKCNYCSYQAKVKSSLKKHMLRHARDEQIDWFKCNQCSFQAKRKGYLKNHMLTHARNEEIDWFKCSHCSYQAKYKGNLKRHMLMHATN